MALIVKKFKNLTTSDIASFNEALDLCKLQLESAEQNECMESEAKIVILENQVVEYRRKINSLYIKVNGMEI